MPNSGSQVILCDLPIRFDTYNGCGHACSYCFTLRRKDIAVINPGESPAVLMNFIQGKRSGETAWCDWDIPLHWGGLSDPFQPVERTQKRSLAALEVFRKTQYPFVVSTKSALIAEEPYLSMIRECNCVVQFSACSPRFDAIEKGAATYSQRIDAARTIAQYKRVNIRVQPYIPGIFKDVLSGIELFADAGVRGIIVEGMKYQKKVSDILIHHGGDFVYPVEMLLPQFRAIKDKAHAFGLKFYCGENRLRALGDELCCCGIEGMGWRENKANLNHILFDPDGVEFTERMKMPGGCDAFVAITQQTIDRKRMKMSSFAKEIVKHAKKPFAYYCNKSGTIYRPAGESVPK